MKSRDNYVTKGGHARLITPSEAAEILGVSVSTLATWRCTQRYDLLYVKTGKNVMYRLEDIYAFIERNLNGAA